MRTAAEESRRGWGLERLPQGVFSAGIPAAKKRVLQTRRLLSKASGSEGKGGRQVPAPTLMGKYPERLFADLM